MDADTATLLGKFAGTIPGVQVMLMSVIVPASGILAIDLPLSLEWAI